ncbi:MAG: transcriptional repressor NrdR [Armatimonadetes bacterium]|nr:transcriptional repressor NrdR [Armatimonadota bacterium]
MRCPYCGDMEDHVVDSRPTYDGKAIRRRRECIRCEKRYTTFERIEDRPLMVIKKDNRREAFDREKILKGMRTACRKRPVGMQTLEDAVDDIEREIYNRMDPEISAQELGRLVMEKLRSVDSVAFVRFASVYKEFREPSQFEEAVAMVGSQS